MNKRPCSAPGRPLTDLEATRIDCARRDLESMQSEDLARLEPADLILLIERLRFRLDDTINLVAEVTQPHPSEPST